MYPLQYYFTKSNIISKVFLVHFSEVFYNTSNIEPIFSYRLYAFLFVITPSTTLRFRRRWCRVLPLA